MRISTFALATAFSFSMAYSWTARAADDDESETSDETPGKAEGADVRVADENGTKEAVKELDPGEIERAKKAEEANSPEEKKNATYYFIGARYRGVLIPKFMMTLFADGGTSVFSHGFGPEFTVRKDNFEYVLSAWYADYGMPRTLFKAKSDGPDAYEFVKSKMKAIYLTTDFNWTSQINPVFGLNFGVGGGVGFFWGDLIRTEAYPDNRGKWHDCVGPGVPNTNYCELRNGQYNEKEPSWAGGGSKPIVFPWFALQTGARIKPHRNFMMRVDLGWALVGPFFGISGSYGL